MSLLNINVMFWNCRSIRNKIFELIHFLNSNNVDICLLSETWLSDENTFYHPQYSCVRRDRVGRNGGGVAILVKKTIQFNIIPCIATEVVENVGIEISFRENSNLRIYSVYFPGGQNNSVFRNKFKSDIRKMLNMPYKYMICGDLNSRHRSWNCLRANPWGNILYDFVSLPRNNIFSKYSYVFSSRCQPQSIYFRPNSIKYPRISITSNNKE